MKGKKTGGRRAGTPNKIGPEQRDYLTAVGGEQGEVWLAVLHRLATEAHPDPHVRVKACLALLSYKLGKPPEHQTHDVTVRLPTVVNEFHDA